MEWSGSIGRIKEKENNHTIPILLQIEMGMLVMGFKKGDMAYLIENHRWIRQVEIMAVSGGFYTVRFCDSESSAIRVRDSRLFKTEEDASKSLYVTGHKEHKKEEIHSVPLH